MVHLAVSSNLAGERGRRVKGGDRESHTGITEKVLTTLNNQKLRGDSIKGIRKRTNFIHCSCIGHHLILITYIITMGGLVKGMQRSHEPFKWSLSRWDAFNPLQTVVTSGAPSFIVGLCNLINVAHCGKTTNVTGFYMCPASNPGKSYCNYPGEYFCKYWGCETIASDWGTKGDPFLRVKFGPAGCTKPRRGPSGETISVGTCSFVYINVSQPEKANWLVGKTWGIRLREPGRDRGNMIQIKKESIPHDPEPVGPNPVIGDRSKGIITSLLIPGRNKTENKSETQDWSERSQSISEYNTLWKVMQATFKVLNDTYPNLTKECWLCYMVKPLFYEAIGSTAEHRWVNGTNPRECLWKKGQDSTPGISLAQVRGKGRCVGNIPRNKDYLCQMKISISDPKQPAQWLLPAINTKWICNTLGVTPCLAINSFNSTSEYCIQVLILPRIAYHSKYYVHENHIIPKHHLTKREPFTALTVAILLGSAGLGTGIASLINQQQGMGDLRAYVDEDLQRIDQAIDGLVKSVRSLSEVVLQNRRGLDLLFLQQGGLCVALREECCTYVDHTGVTVDAMAELKKQIKQRKRIQEAQKSWYESWFNRSPWFTTLLSTLAGPLILLVLTLTFGPCIFNKLINIVKGRLEATHLMLVRAKYDPLNAGEIDDYLELSRKELVRYSEQKE